MNSHAADFAAPELRKYLDLYVRGSGGASAEQRVKLMKLLWDCLGTEFGGRHELYEINYGGSTEEIRRYCLFAAQNSGAADTLIGGGGSDLNAQQDFTAQDDPNAQPMAQDGSVSRRSGVGSENFNGA